MYLAIRNKVTGLYMVNSPMYISWGSMGRTWTNPSSAKGHMTRVRNLILTFKEEIAHQKKMGRPIYKWQQDKADLDPSEWEIVKVKMVVDDTP